jgi:hypothetical protein
MRPAVLARHYRRITANTLLALTGFVDPKANTGIRLRYR